MSVHSKCIIPQGLHASRVTRPWRPSPTTIRVCHAHKTAFKQKLHLNGSMTHACYVTIHIHTYIYYIYILAVCPQVATEGMATYTQCSVQKWRVWRWATRLENSDARLKTTNIQTHADNMCMIYVIYMYIIIFIVTIYCICRNSSGELLAWRLPSQLSCCRHACINTISLSRQLIRQNFHRKLCMCISRFHVKALYNLYLRRCP